MVAVGPNFDKASGRRHSLPGGLLLLAALLAAIAAPCAKAQLGADTAQVATLMGQVSLERAGELWTLTAGQTVQAGQAIVTGGDGYAQLSLPDGSVLEVFPNSRLVFRANRGNWRDLLDLYLGKVRLQIQHLTGDGPPLRVTSPTAVISVRGTVFEVEVDAMQETIVSVETGLVGVRHRLIPGQEVMVEAGQSLRVLPTAPLAAAAPRPAVPLAAVGRVVRAVADTWARINAARGSEGSAGNGSAPPPSTADKPSPSGPSAAPGAATGDAGSNEPAPPPEKDKTGETPAAPPGDAIP
jgi:ferric-dicitrate binding protein FerR (iron transport regulator)